MTDALFETVAKATKALAKYGISAEEFAAVLQQNSMTDAEVLAVAKVFDFLMAKRDRSSVEFLLRTSRLPMKVPKTFDNFDFSLISGRNVERLRNLPTLSALYPTKTLPLLDGPAPARPVWPRLLGGPAVSTGLGLTSLR